MTSLKEIFSKFSYENILLIADEYNFFPDKELPKDEYIYQFSRFLIAKGLDDQIIIRYGEQSYTPQPATKEVNLYAFQVRHKMSMIEGLDKHITFLNASETGTGKTYKTLSLAETEHRPLFVVCPKSVVLDWYLLAMKHKVNILAICNYETLIKGKMYEFSDNAKLDKLPRVDNPYLKKVELTKRIGNGSKVTFEWKDLPQRTLIVFDEAHMCKNIAAQRTQLLISVYDYARHPENLWRKIGILLLSATIIEKRQNLKPFMYVLGYANRPNDGSLIDSPSFNVRKFGQKLMTERRMTRSTMAEARRALNDTHTSDIRTKMFKLDEEARGKIEKLCQEIRDILLASKDKRPHNHLALRLQKRQEIEALKTGIFHEELTKLRKEGWSVVVFVCFKKTLDALIAMVKEPHSVIRGGQKATERLGEVDKFQSGETNIMLSMIGAGGTGISLHDTKGGRPRYALHSPPESATQAIQAFGRVDRIGAKTDSKQCVIFVANTIEEKIAESLNRKMQTIGDLNNDQELVDNLFLFEVYHEYNGTNDVEADVHEDEDEPMIQVSVNKQEKQVIVTVPDYMVDEFETSLPAECINGMKIFGDKYKFPLKQYYTIIEFLQRLNR